MYVSPTGVHLYLCVFTTLSFIYPFGVPIFCLLVNLRVKNLHFHKGKVRKGRRQREREREKNKLKKHRA